MKKILMLCFFMAGLVAGTLGCEKKPQGPGLGTEVSIVDIETAQNNSLIELDPYQVKKGQKVHKIETQEVVTSQGPLKSIIEESTIEVIEVEDVPGARLLTTLKKILDLQTKDKFVYEVKNVFALAPLADKVTTEGFQLQQSLDVQALVEKNVTASEIEGVSFHNLQKKQAVLVPPERVKESEDCRGLNPCEIKSDILTYDIVFHLSDGTHQKHSIEWFISPNVPFFAGILKQCATTLVPVEDLRVLVKQCNEVVDFNQ